MIKKAWEKDKRKVKKLVEGNNFDYFILSLICIDAVALGFMTSDITNVFFDNVLFILDRLCMAIFIMEMLMKLYAYGKGFFKSGWNVFDLIVVAVSSVPFASYFIVLRTFRLFRSLKYVNKFSRLKSIINTFIALLPIFVAMLAVFVAGLYAGRLGFQYCPSGYVGIPAFLAVLRLLCLHLLPDCYQFSAQCSRGSGKAGVSAQIPVIGLYNGLLIQKSQDGSVLMY